MGRIHTYICGETGPIDEFNPFKVTRQEHMPEMLFLLNSNPMSSSDLSRELGIENNMTMKLLDDLSKINAASERDSKWSTTFAIFGVQDIHLLAERTKKPASHLAERLMRNKPEIEKKLAQLSCAGQVEMKKLAFAVVGCYLLDWRGLEVLNQRDLTLCGKKQQPGDRKYVLLGREAGVKRDLYEKVYWGSTKSDYDGITFTSFGDHVGNRYAFPEIARPFSVLTQQQTEKAGLPDWLTTKASEAIDSFQTNSIVDCGRLLLLLGKKGPMSASQLANEMSKGKEQVEALLKLLADMKYVSFDSERAKLNYPVFTVRDKSTIDAVWGIVSSIVEEEACSYFGSIRTELAETTPVMKGIDPREVYTDVWHWVFGHANRIMAERGFFFDPPKEREGEGRYISWVEQK
jgi:hypothetical protein